MYTQVVGALTERVHTVYIVLVWLHELWCIYTNLTCINDLVYVRRLVCAGSWVAQVDVPTRMVWVYIGVLSVTYYSLVELTKLRLCHIRSNVHTQAKGAHM